MSNYKVTEKTALAVMRENIIENPIRTGISLMVNGEDSQIEEFVVTISEAIHHDVEHAITVGSELNWSNTHICRDEQGIMVDTQPCRSTAAAVIQAVANELKQWRETLSNFSHNEEISHAFNENIGGKEYRFLLTKEVLNA